MGLGVGLGVQQPMIAIQTIFNGPNLAVATSVMIFLQSLAGTIFLSVAQNIFEGKVQSIVVKTLPGVNPADVLGVGASDLGAAMRKKYPGQADAILDAYNEGLRSVFLISVIFACAGSVSLPFMEWRSVKKDKQSAATKSPEKGSDAPVEAEKST